MMMIKNNYLFKIKNASDLGKIFTSILLTKIENKFDGILTIVVPSTFSETQGHGETEPPSQNRNWILFIMNQFVPLSFVIPRVFQGIQMEGFDAKI